MGSDGGCKVLGATVKGEEGTTEDLRVKPPRRDEREAHGVHGRTHVVVVAGEVERLLPVQFGVLPRAERRVASRELTNVIAHGCRTAPNLTNHQDVRKAPERRRRPPPHDLQRPHQEEEVVEGIEEVIREHFRCTLVEHVLNGVYVKAVKVDEPAEVE